MRIRPLGNRILVLPMKKENFVTETNIELVDNSLSCGEVIEFAPMFEGVYKKGDVILYSKDAGSNQSYNGKSHIWLNGQGHYGGDVWAIIGNTKSKK